MKYKLLISLFVLGLAAVPAMADEPLLIFDRLPMPLKLPPGLVETLPLNHTASFFGDAIRVVDCAGNSLDMLLVNQAPAGRAT